MGPDNQPVNPERQRRHYRQRGPTPDYPFYGPSTRSKAQVLPPTVSDPHDIDPAFGHLGRKPPSPAQQYNLSVWGTRSVPQAPAVAAIRVLARSLAPEAVDILASIMRDTDAPAPARVAAAGAILDRGCGKAVQPVEDATPGPDLATLIRGVAPADLAALVELARAVREARMEAQGIVETTATEG